MTEPVSAGLSAAKWLGSFRPGYWTKRHNRIVEREYEDRVRWAGDENPAEELALAAFTEELNKKNLLYSGDYDAGRARIHAEYAQRWRDRKSEGERKIEDAHDEENALHWLWRRLVRRSWPEDPYAAEVERLTHDWD